MLFFPPRMPFLSTGTKPNEIKQWAIEKTQVVGHEYVGFMFFYNIDTGHLDPNPENFWTESQGIFTGPEKRSRTFEQEAEK
jgi:hypothetical protein